MHLKVIVREMGKTERLRSTGLRRQIALSTVLVVALLMRTETALAAAAQLYIHPTLVELDDRQRSATVNIVNRGDAAGAFAIAWVDYAMTAEGGLAATEGDVSWSLQPHVRYSPRRVTLRPGETQLIKIALRRSKDAPEGEYYSHLKVLTLNDDIDGTAGLRNGSSASERPAVTIEARSAIAVPVIWRNSRAEPRAVIDSVRIDADLHELSVDVQRLGDLSTRGYLHVLRTARDGSRHALAEPMPLVIYPSLKRRVVKVPLSNDAGDIDLGIHTDVVYSPALEFAGAKPELASYRLLP